MENRGKILFEEDTFPAWYLASGDQWMGPLTVSDVYEKIIHHEASWADYLWKLGCSEWERACESKIFQTLVPKEPSREVQAKVKKLASPSVSLPSIGLGEKPREKNSKKEWFVHQGGAQYGPFSFGEIGRLLLVGKIPLKSYLWKDGMPSWESLEKIREFHESVTNAKKNSNGKLSAQKKQKLDLRGAPRRPLVARIFLTHQDSVIVAVCRDISVGGMQVLTDRVPGKEGARIKMNVSPSGDSKGYRIQPFVAEGVIVRVLEDQCGFSFRFEKLPDRARRAIQNYIEESN